MADSSLRDVLVTTLKLFIVQDFMFTMTIKTNVQFRTEGFLRRPQALLVTYAKAYADKATPDNPKLQLANLDEIQRRCTLIIDAVISNFVAANPYVRSLDYDTVIYYALLDPDYVTARQKFLDVMRTVQINLDVDVIPEKTENIFYDIGEEAVDDLEPAEIIEVLAYLQKRGVPSNIPRIQRFLQNIYKRLSGTEVPDEVTYRQIELLTKGTSA